jgi:collagenase-like PrtC family protease
MGAVATGIETCIDVGVVTVVVGVVVEAVVGVLAVQADIIIMADIMIVEIANEIMFFPFILNLPFKITSSYQLHILLQFIINLFM